MTDPLDAVAQLDPIIDFSLYDNDGPDGIPSSGDDDGLVDEYDSDQYYPVSVRICTIDQFGDPIYDASISLYQLSLTTSAGTASASYASSSGQGWQATLSPATVQVIVDGRSSVLHPGDAYYFSSRLPHQFRNPGPEPCELISACTPPSF